MTVTGPLVLTLDVGTSSVRSMLFDTRGRSLPDAETKLDYVPRVAGDGTAEVDFEDLQNLVHRALDAGLSRAGRADVAVVGFSMFWHGLLGIDGRGRPTTPVILWSDTRSWRQAERLRRDVDVEAVRLRTGCPVHPSYWPAKLAWLRETAPAAWARTASWASAGDLLYQRLFGQLGTSPSMASGTGLRALDGGWDGELLELLGVDERRLPPEVGRMRGLKGEPGRRWPALRDVDWLTAVGDGALANLGTACVDASQRALTVGTSGALRVLTQERPARLAPGLWCYLLEPGRYVVGGSSSNGGNLYAWLLRTLRLDARALERQLGRRQPGSSGLTFLPLLAGERSPGFAARATGAISGLTQATTAEDIAHAGLEAIAITFATIDRALDESVPGAVRLVASGGALVRSPAWVQMMADAIGKPVAVLRSAAEASSQGAAELALAGAGRRPGVRRRIGRNVEPRETARALYQEANSRQERMYTTLIEGSSRTW